MKSIKNNLVFLVLFVVSILAIAVTVFACAWPETDHSVRFNGFRTSRDFGRLPPLPKHEKRDQDSLPWYNAEEDYDQHEKRIKKIDGLWDETEKARKKGSLIEVRRDLSEYLERSADMKSEIKKGQERRNSAFDQLDALTSLDNGSKAASIIGYLEAALEPLSS